MRRPSLFVLACLCVLFATPAWGQRSPVVYFSTGATSPSQIYSLNTRTGATILLVSTANADWESLVVGPGVQPANYPAPPATAVQSFSIYACDPVHNKIVRFDPNGAVPVVPRTVSTSVAQPVCGRFTSNGTLIVDSKAGTGPWEISGKNADENVVGVATLPLGTPQCAGNVETSCISAPQEINLTVANETTPLGSGWGVALKNVGAALIADNTNGQILLLSAPFNTPPSATNSTLSTFASPNTVQNVVGIARKSTGEVFVSTQGRTPGIVELDANGSSLGTCGSLPNGNWTPNFIQMSLDDTLYAALSANSKGQILALDTTTCSSTPVVTSFALNVPAVGVALPPTISTRFKSPISSDSMTYTFQLGNNALFQVKTGGGCAAPQPLATAEELSPATVQALIDNAKANDPTNLPFGGSPTPDRWSDGFQVVFDAHFDTCDKLATTPPIYEELLSNFIDPSLSSTRLVFCDGDPLLCHAPANDNTNDNFLFGVWSTAGVLPGDGTWGSGTKVNSQFFSINAKTSTTAGTGSTAQGTFCGYQSPLPGPFSSGQSLSVKFKLGAGTGKSVCKNGPYISQAEALISVSRVCVPAPGALPSPPCPAGFSSAPPDTANLIDLAAEGSSTPVPPFFKVGNSQYQFSLSLNGYLPGIYSLTTSFLTGNTTDQTILFQVQ